MSHVSTHRCPIKQYYTDLWRIHTHVPQLQTCSSVSHRTDRTWRSRLCIDLQSPGGRSVCVFFTARRHVDTFFARKFVSLSQPAQVAFFGCVPSSGNDLQVSWLSNFLSQLYLHIWRWWCTGCTLVSLVSVLRVGLLTTVPEVGTVPKISCGILYCGNFLPNLRYVVLR